MRRRGWIVGGAAVAAAAAGVGWRLSREGGSGGTGDAIDAFWRMSFEQPGGGTLKTSSLLGKPLLLNFWATWCPPCVQEMPELDRFHREFSPRGWQVLGLAVDRVEPVRDYLRRSPVGYPIAMAGLGGTDLSRALGNTAGGLPFTAIFGANGRVLRRKLGQTNFDELVGWVTSK